MAQQRVQRLVSFLNALDEDTNWCDAANYKSDLAQGAVLTYQALCQKNGDSGLGHFRYSFSWTDGGPYSQELQNVYRKTHSAVGLVEKRQDEPYCIYARDHVRPLLTHRSDKLSLGWVRVVSSIVYLSSQYRGGGDNPLTVQRSVTKINRDFGVSFSMTYEAALILRQKGVLE
jgi:hypothetical protein